MGEIRNFPKVIHLCWFSGQEIPAGIKRCIDTWKENFPDYTIKIWDREMALSMNIPFATEAISVKKWAFAADVVRCYALYREGGIYLDSDIEVVRRFDELIDGYSVALFNESHYYSLDEASKNTDPKSYMGIQAACMMAYPGHPLFKKFLDYYSERHFIRWNGTYSCIISPIIFGEIAAKEGYVYEDRKQIFGDVILYPSTFVAPEGGAPMSKDRVAIHLCTHSWDRKTTNVVRRVISYTTAIIKQLAEHTLSMLRKEKDSTSEFPLISVIVPNYNHARYLDQRLKTILNQTYRNIEVIILDDCSSDNSLEIISNYTSDPRVSAVIANAHNSGSPFFQWDKGIHQAKGELIWIAESDDYCELNLLEELVKAFRDRHDTLLSYCTPEYVDEFGNRWKRQWSKEGKTVHMCSSSYIRRYLIDANFPLNASCCLFRRDVALKISDRYKTIGAAGDYMFWAELLSNKGSVTIVNQHLSKWRVHSDSVTAVMAKDGKLAFSDKEIFDFLCSVVFISKVRKRYAIRYHIRDIRNQGIESTETLEKIYAHWNYDQVSHLNFFDKAYNKINEYLYKFFNTKLSY